MSEVDGRAAIGKLFSEAWLATTPVAYPNRDFTPPQDGSWVQLGIAQGDAFPVEIGSGGQKRHPGTVLVQVFTKLGEGDGPGLTLAEQAAAIFRDVTVTAGTNANIRFRTPTVRNIGPGDAYYQVNVAIPFVRDAVF